MDTSIDVVPAVATRSSSVTQFLSIIIPTRNEAGNINPLLEGIQSSLPNQPFEVIFVDDSNDDTPGVIQAAEQNNPGLCVKLIHREGDERIGGLGGAVVAGLKAASGDYACVMDADLQHPPSLLPVLLKTAIENHSDLVVATRRSQDSQVDGLNFARNLISKTLDLTARVFFPVQLKGVSDPLTGYFLLRTNALNIQALKPKGFKILLEILVRNPRLKKSEVPFHFGERLTGQSKASAREVFKYLNLLWTLRFGERSLRFIGFALVGLSGVLVNSLVLYAATEYLKIFYLYSTAIATTSSSIWNFALNEFWVYKNKESSSSLDKRLLFRFAIFFLMNIAALSLRAPLIYVFTTFAGIHYVVSNLISLALLTVVRFLLADNLIWSSNKAKIPMTNK